MIRPSPIAAPPPGSATPGGRQGVPNPAAVLLSQVAPIIAIENDPPPLRRWALGAAAMLLAIALGIYGAQALAGHGHGLLWLGLGRLARLADERGWAIAPVLSSLEHFNLALITGWFAISLIAGASTAPRTLMTERIVFHRRQSARLSLPWLSLTLALLIFGQSLAFGGHPILAGLIEIPGLILLVDVSRKLLLPEARTCLTVIIDLKQGFGNRIVISGGRYNRGGQIHLRHDDFIGARPLDGDLTRPLRINGLRIVHSDSAIPRGDLILPGAGTPDQVALLAALLNSQFTRALTRKTLNYPASMQRGVPQI